MSAGSDTLADRPVTDARAPSRGVTTGSQHVDVLIVGAGLSGIAAAYYVRSKLPRKTYAIVEGREVIGGTWDLFRYPGVRSDSDMHTLGFSFRPWGDDHAIAGGEAIRDYVVDTAKAYGIDREIRFGHRIVRASWSSAQALWSVEAQVGPERTPVTFTCGFLFMCSGYYDYAEGYQPAWPGVEHFGGMLVHPQKWPQDLDVTGKRVVVIGSGATAVTLVPALAATAAHVTMLQRSPTYVVARPAKDVAANWLNRRLPARLAHPIVRWKNVLLGMYFYRMARRQPDKVKAGIAKLARQQLGDSCDVATHFNPTYNPWDQRLCLVPDGDLFVALRSGKASVQTDTIDGFTESGIRLRSGTELDADIVVTATGLKVQMLGGMQVVVDGNPVELGKQLSYKGMMFSDVPNLAVAFGYTNASWTLKCELTARYVCRLIAHMDARGITSCTPRRNEATIVESPGVELTSGYIQRAQAILPKQGTKAPWKLHQNYALDLAMLRFGSVDDGVMEFKRPLEARKAA